MKRTARKPDTAAARKPTSNATPPGPPDLAAEVVKLEEKRPEDGRDAEQEGEASRRLPVEAQEDARGYGRTGAAETGRDGQGLIQTHDDGVGAAHLREGGALPPEMGGAQDGQVGADTATRW